MDPISTEYPFVLPIGYRGPDGYLYREGVMRLATAGDEIYAMRDHRVQANAAYLTAVLLARVVTLDKLEVMSTSVIEDLFLRDFNYLQKLYDEINGVDQDSTAAELPSDMRASLPGNVEALPVQASFTKR
ncbi:hypothetical protein WKR88_26080 [Trinickia caryophylli]|uniref:Phage tail assembly chaperone protein, E, or 41 or 14 n=1 Tax=Trinickia caryophylli TaxID=28094 RepID=A0A1X7GA55_TRICW|nr:hypothetical protein [Trinickia caryophylli]WQE11699.1 hypothetical protein U0034_18460 [Trinickia caryophylli]GLU34884.1 hypothetical protein Busp01_47260 [Trinickia caryophylli]SMF66580.1 hypothetical protein SAMN06295900_114132 [Trinickia caryophylli]